MFSNRHLPNSMRAAVPTSIRIRPVLAYQPPCLCRQVGCIQIVCATTFLNCAGFWHQ
jgi:hypothetical protein